MALDSKVKDLLNKFADSQIALNIQGEPADSSAIQIGTLLDEAHGALRSGTVKYDVLNDGGVSGQTYILDGHKIPAGAIITRAWIAEQVNVVGVGASLDVLVGTTSLTGGAALIAEFVGVKESVAGFTATLPEVTSGGNIKVTVSGANVTAGKLLISFEYIYPV